MGGAHDSIHVGVQSRESKPPLRERSVGDQHRGVALTPRRDVASYVKARHPFHRVHNLPDRESAPSPKIDRVAFAATEQVPDGGDMRIREIGDVDVVADGGAVRGRVVVAEDGDLVQTAHRGEDCPRDEVCFGLVALADLAVGVAAAGIKVSEANRTQAVGGFVVCQCVLDRELRASVGIHGCERGLLGDRHTRGLAVDRTGRGEHDRHIAYGTRGVEQAQCADDVVGIVLGGVLE